MARDLGYNLKGKVWGDASAALGIIHRKGLGRTRHIDTRYLWVRQVAAQRRLKYSKVLGRDNQADLYTKHLDASTASRHVGKLNCWHLEGRSSIAPDLHMVSISWLTTTTPTRSMDVREGINGHAQPSSSRPIGQPRAWKKVCNGMLEKRSDSKQHCQRRGLVTRGHTNKH